jgi:hypothetical protein
MRAAAVCLLCLLAAACRPPPAHHTVVSLTNCRCGDVARTADPSPVLSFDVGALPGQPTYHIEVVNRYGRIVASGSALRSGTVALFTVPVRLGRGAYFVRVEDAREYVFTVGSSVTQ